MPYSMNTHRGAIRFVNLILVLIFTSILMVWPNTALPSTNKPFQELCELDQDYSIPKADMVIFSYDRPLQLYALLESTYKYITGLGDIKVIYRTSDDRYASAYQKVSDAFCKVAFIKQGNKPSQNFKPLKLKAVFGSPNTYIVFAVDDIVVKDYVDLSDCIGVLANTGAYGFYLRMGKNLNWCYPLSRSQQVPPTTRISKDIYSWQFTNGEHDWHYPNTVDMTLYRKKDIEQDLNSMNFRSPNIFEGQWSCRAGRVKNRIGLCFEKSKIVNLPLNRVQKDWHNRHMNFVSCEALLDLFENDLKMDIAPLYQIDNVGAHMDYEPMFIER